MLLYSWLLAWSLELASASLRERTSPYWASRFFEEAGCLLGGKSEVEAGL